MIILFLIFSLLCPISKAETQIYLQQTNYYLDDFNGQISPELGFDIKSLGLEGDVNDDLYVGFGYITQPLDSAPSESLNGWFSEVIYKVNYNIDKDFFITAGAGFVNNRQAYGGGLDHHFNIGLQYRLK